MRPALHGAGFLILKTIRLGKKEITAFPHQKGGGPPPSEGAYQKKVPYRAIEKKEPKGEGKGNHLLPAVAKLYRRVEGKGGGAAGLRSRPGLVKVISPRESVLRPHPGH